MAVSGINTLNTVANPVLGANKPVTGSTGGASFSDMLQSAMDNVNDLQLQSQQSLNDFAVGKTDNIQDVMIASEKADIALQFTMQVRNKVLDAYSEIMRIQI